MADPQSAQPLGAGLAQLPVDLSELPPEIAARIAERARSPDRRVTVGGRYLVIGELGRGGMGVVYEAWDPRIDRRVAIKTIEPDLVPEEEREEIVERFRRETKVVGRLHHPGIVTIFDYGEERGGPNLHNALYYYVMEYLEGHSLARVLRDRRTLPDIEAVSITADIADALQISHDAGVIHRDIKPSNIFLKNGKQAVLLDFGIAKTQSVALTRQGQILGTPSYLAPERLREKEVAVDGRADIFSLGVLMFTMLTGEAPFVGDDVYDVIDKISRESHPKLSRTAPGGQALSRVLDRMLAKKPEDRYPSASNAAGALREVLYLLRQTVPETEDLMGVRPREAIEGAATEIAQALTSADEEDTGRQPIELRGEPATRPERQVVDLPEEDEPLSVEALDVDTPADQPPPQDLLGTMPEVPLDRESFDMERPDGEGAARTAIMPRVESGEGSDPDAGAYRPHAPSNDEVTDDATLADDESAVGLDRRRTQLENPMGRHPLGAQLSPTVTKGPSDTAVQRRPTSQKLKPPVPPTPSKVSGSGPRTPVPPPLPESVPDGASRTAAQRAEKSDRPSVRPAAQRPGRSQPGSKRSRIEASLVDEDDVVVKPAPFDTLKPDELPTQTGFKLPGSHSGPHAPVSPLPASHTLNDEVVSVRGDDRVPDPAETGARRMPGVAEDLGESTEGGELLSSDTEDERDRDGEAEVDEQGFAEPRSAAVARKTFGSSGAQVQRPGKAPIVKVSGSSTLNADRVRIVRRRGFMLLAAMLAAIAIGLLLGRMKQRSALGDPQPNEARPAIEQPRASQALRDEHGEPELIRPRAPTDLLQDATAALTDGKVARAERLFESVVRAAPDHSRLKGQAMLGRADALRQLGSKDAAIELYKLVLSDIPRSPEADEAKAALMELGVNFIEAVPRSGGARGGSAQKRVERESAERREKPAGSTVSPDIPKEVTSEMSSEDKCRAILAKNINDPREAVRGLSELGRQDPRASCVYWHLGNKYMMLGDDRAALEAYRRYLELRPDAPKRPAVEERIKNLTAKVERGN